MKNNRNIYSKEFENEMFRIASTMTFNELLYLAKTKYKYDITKKQLQQYLSKRKIRYKDYNVNKAQDMGNKTPIGTEYVKPDGMILVKVAKDKWIYKQRLIYQQYYNVELTDNDYIIFLDQNRNNFNIDNLKRISRHESSVLSNQKLFSNNPLVTETGIELAKLIIKVKEKKNEKRLN